MKALIPLDGSSFSRQVIPAVCRLLSPEAYELLLLHVAALPDPVPAEPLRPILMSGWDSLEHERLTSEQPVYASQAWEGFRAMLRDSMAPDVASLKESGFAVSVAVRFGDPAEEIADLAREEDVALVAMVTHGRTGFSRLIMGSVAERVLRSLEVPLLLIKPQEADPEAQAITLPYDMR